MMQRRALAISILAALTLLFGFIGRATEADALYFLSGLCFFVAVGVAFSYLPLWRRMRERMPPMPGLFPRVRGGQWDSARGQIQRRRHK